MEREKLRMILERSGECGSVPVPQLREWLENFSKSVKSKAEDLQAQIDKLSDNTSSVEQHLNNTFNSFRLLFNTQFIENRVYEEDETLAVKQGESEEQRRLESYEDDILPRYKEAVTLAWSAHEEASKASRIREATHRQLPFIIGSEEFMHDPYGGLPDPRVSSSELRDYDSETEKDGVNMAAEMVRTGVLSDGEWSETSNLDEQDDHEPAVSAALDFKAMLEAALRGTYVPHDDGLKREVNASDRKRESASTGPNLGNSERNASEPHSVIPRKEVDGGEASFQDILGKIAEENVPEYITKNAEKSLNPPSTAAHLLSNITLLRQPDLDRSSSSSSWSTDAEEDTQTKGVQEDTHATEDVHDDAPASESVEALGHVSPGRHEDEEEADKHSMLMREATETQTAMSPGFDKDGSISDKSMSSKPSTGDYGDAAISSDSPRREDVRTSVVKQSLEDVQQAVAAFRSSTLSTLLFGDEEEDEGDALFGPVGSVKIC